MNNFQIGILAVALALNSFATFLIDGFVLRPEDLARKIRFALVNLFFQAIMAGAGLWLGVKMGTLAVNSNFYISLGILSVMGLKIIFDSVRTRQEDKSFDLSEMHSIVLLAVAEGITPLIVGISIGLTVEILLIPWIILVLLQAAAILSGLVYGPHHGTASVRFRSGMLGGLILLAAALKLLMNLIGY